MTETQLIGNAIIGALSQVVDVEGCSEVLLEIIGDIRSNKLDDAEQLSPITTVGDVRALGAFWNDDEAMRHMATMTVTEITKQLLEDGNLDPRGLPIEIVKQLVEYTNRLSTAVVANVRATINDDTQPDTAASIRFHQSLFANMEAVVIQNKEMFEEYVAPDLSSGTVSAPASKIVMPAHPTVQ